MSTPVNANINVLINTEQATAQLRSLQAQINSFNNAAISSSSAAAAKQIALNKALMDSASASGMFNARIVPVTSSVDRFSQALDKGKLSLGEYTRYAASQMPSLSRVFKKEFDMMASVAEDRVKRIQTQYTALGKSQKALSLQPTALAMEDFGTKAAIAAQKQMLFNKMIDDGSTKLLNWGKNTQWAGRQLMVGFSLPLAAFGAIAAKTFMEIDKATISLKRVYGDLDTTKEELNANVEAVKGLGKEYTKYGITLADTIKLSGRAAATGATNEKLMAATEQTLRFATLGQMDYNQALDTTISLQTAFNISNEDLGKTVDYLNAVENQTILTMEDMSLAIPRVATVVQGLGGSVEDLAIMMTAMREGGVSAENAANGLKSGLASLINPTKRASEGLAGMGINLKGIINQNKGDLMGIVTEFGAAINKLDGFSRQQVLEKVFGKFQYARMSALFTNITKDSGQAARAMDIAAMSAEELASISEKELGQISESTSVKFQAAMEQLKIAIAPIGEAFLKALTPVISVVTKIADAFNNLPDGVKNATALIIGLVAGIGPIILMTVGLLANGFANIVKFIQTLRRGFSRIKGDASVFDYLSNAELDAAAAAQTLEGKTSQLTSSLRLQKDAVQSLIGMYGRYTKSAGLAATALPTTLGGGGRRGRGQPPTLRMADGGVVPGSGSGDKIPALLEPGETVVTKKASQRYAPVIAAMNAGTLPGYKKGKNANVPNLVGATMPEGLEFRQDTRTTQGIELFFNRIREAAIAAGTLDDTIERTNAVLASLAAAGKRVSSSGFMAAMAQQGFAPQLPGARYNAKAAGETRTVEQQLLAERPSTGAKEYATADAASRAAGDAMEAYEEERLKQLRYEGKLKDDQLKEYKKNSDKRVKSARQVDRAHTIEIKNNEEKLIFENWQSQNWKAQSGAENQLSQIMQSSPRTQRAYLAELERSEFTEQQKQEIARKVTKGMALTEQELQLQKRILEKMLRDTQIDVSPGFRSFATGAVAAAEVRQDRFNSDSGERDAIESGRSYGRAAVTGTKKAMKINSPSEAYAEVMDDAAEGMVVGAKRSSKVAASSGKMLAQSAREAYKMEMSHLRRDMRNVGVMEAGGMTDATQQTRQLRRLEESRQKARTVELVETKRMAKLADENARLAAQSARAMLEQELAMQEQVLVSQQGGGDASGKKDIRGKIMGASMGASGIAIGLSMMDNAVGQFAQKLMPAMIALDVASTAMMLLGETTVKTALKMALVAAPWALAIAAIGLFVWNIKQSTDKQNELIAANQKYIDAALGSAGAMTAFARQTGKSTLMQQAAASFASSEGITTAQKGFAADFTQGEAGKGVVKSVGMLSGKERLSSLTAQVTQALAAGFLTAGQAKAVARQVSIELNDPMIGHAVVTSINGQLKKDGKTLRKTASEVFMGTISDTMSPQLDVVKNKILENQALVSRLKNEPRPEGATGRTWLAPMGATVSKEEGGAAFQIAATNATKYREALALLTIEKNKGTITQKEYNQLSKEASTGLSDQITAISQLNTVLGVSGKDYVGGYFKEYAKGMGMTEEQFTQLESSVESVKSSLGTIPKDFVTKLTFSVASGGLSLDELKNLDSIFKLSEGGAQYKAEFDLLINQEGMSVEDATRFYLSIYNTEDTIKKQIIMVASVYGLKAAEDLKATLIYMEGISNQNLKKELGIAIEGADAKRLAEAADYLSYLDSVPNKRDFITNLTTYITEITTTKKIGEAVLSGNDMYAIRAAQRGVTGSTPAEIAAQKAALDESKRLAIAARDAAGGAGNGDKEGDGGGGSKTKSILQQLIADTEANLKIFPGMLNKIKDKFGKKNLIPQAIIDSLGAGEDGLKNLQELLNMSKSKVKQLIADYTKTTSSQTLVNIKKAGTEKRQQINAQGILERQGFSKEDAKSLSSNAEDALLIINAAAGKTKESLKAVMTALRATLDTVDPNEKAISDLNQQIEDTNLAYKQQVQPVNEAISAKQKEIDVINDQIDAKEKLNLADSRTIRNLERQKEMIQRQIDALQRLNDTDQTRIDSIKREDELRNRVSDALSHDLDIMSQQEKVIQDNYNKRVNALDEIAKVNEYIVSQQKGQLGLAQALSQGDVYAAAAAQQEMLASSDQNASQQMKDSLKVGMENQVAGLTTAGGLTREQAEAQIASIKEQSYQTSLQIRDIEDAIYNRNLEMAPLKKQQYDVDVLIQGVQDTIYKRETEIIGLQDGKLANLQTELGKLNDIKAGFDDILEAQISSLELKIDDLKLLDGQKERVDKIANAWYKVKKEILDAQRLASGDLKDLGPAPKPDELESKEDYQARVDAWTKKRDAILAKRDASSNASLNSGKAAIKLATGGMATKGGAYKSPNLGINTSMSGSYKSPGAQVVGAGGGDSVSAMLTPGEFVMRRASVQKYGMPMLSRMNMGSFDMPRYNTQQPIITSVQPTSNTSNINAPVYNTYSVNVSANTNASADDIANTVMTKIKKVDSMAVRSFRGY